MASRKVLFALIGAILLLSFCRADPITIHVVTHSHLDAGWIYPVDQCFTTVDHIFTTVLESLLVDPKRRYTVGDMYFFRRWYESKAESDREAVRDFVRNGQIEIVHGGAVSTDEATVSFHDFMNNMITSR